MKSYLYQLFNRYPKNTHSFILRKKDITPVEKLLLIFILEKITDYPEFQEEDECPLSYGYIAQGLCIDRRNIPATLASLEEKKYIIVKRQKNGKYNKTNIINISPFRKLLYQYLQETYPKFYTKDGEDVDINDE